MVSGLVTSPWDQDRIISGLAIDSRHASKFSRFSMSVLTTACLSNVVHVVALVALEMDTKIEWNVGDVLLTEEDLVLVVGLDLHAEREPFELLDEHTE